MEAEKKMDFWATEFASVLAFQGPKCRSVSVPARGGLKVGKMSANGGRLAGKTPRRPPNLQHGHFKSSKGMLTVKMLFSLFSRLGRPSNQLPKKLQLDPAPPAHPLNCGPTPDRGKKLDSETQRRSVSRHEAEAKPGKVIGDSRNRSCQNLTLPIQLYSVHSAFWPWFCRISGGNSYSQKRLLGRRESLASCRREGWPRAGRGPHRPEWRPLAAEAIGHKRNLALSFPLERNSRDQVPGLVVTCQAALDDSPMSNKEWNPKIKRVRHDFHRRQ